MSIGESRVRTVPASGKLHLRSLPLGLAGDLEEFLRPKAEHVRDEHAWKGGDRRVVILYKAVVVLPRHAQPILRAGELGRELLEIRVGLQVRISLGQCEY